MRRALAGVCEADRGVVVTSAAHTVPLLLHCCCNAGLSSLPGISSTGNAWMGASRLRVSRDGNETAIMLCKTYTGSSSVQRQSAGGRQVPTIPVQTLDAQSDYCPPAFKVACNHAYCQGISNDVLISCMYPLCIHTVPTPPNHTTAQLLGQACPPFGFLPNQL